MRSTFLKPSWLTGMIRLSGVFLIIVCAAKFIAVYSGSKVLAAKEGLTGISYGTLTTLIAMLEAVIGTMAAFFPHNRFSIYSVGWLGVMFAGYRVIRKLLGFMSPCRCLGSLFAWWPWGAAHESAFAWGVIAILLLSSGLSMLSPFTDEAPVKGNLEPLLS